MLVTHAYRSYGSGLGEEEDEEDNVAKRNKALQVVAEDAADAGDSDIVKRVLQKMTNVDQDDAAYSCALKLAKQGKRNEAAEVAQKITDVTKKNDALSRIGTGNA